MKKLLISAILLLGSFSMASAELGVKIGVSGNMGEFTATGSENENGTISKSAGEEDASMLGAMGSVFGEINLGFLLYSKSLRSIDDKVKSVFSLTPVVLDSWIINPDSGVFAFTSSFGITTLNL